jgi:hypothetical protein
MSFLLGSQSCIDGLRSDLSDIQETIDEILVRTGALKYETNIDLSVFSILNQSKFLISFPEYHIFSF